LIADVRGYTRFTQQEGDEAASELAARFARIVGDEVPGFGGELVELRGDEALCVFHSARQALRAAIALQRCFRMRSDGAAAFPLGVGMGLDSGEAVPTGGGFRGKALNLAARLCALAAPGQVLATEGVVHLAHRVEGIRFVNRRPVRLKGVEEPVRVVEVRSLDELPPVPLPLAAPRKRPRRAVLALSGCLLGCVAVLGVVLPRVVGSGSSASFRAGVVLIDLNSGQQVGFVSPARVAEPGFPVYADGHFWLFNFTPSAFVEVDERSAKVLRQFAPPRGSADRETYQPYAVAGDSLWTGAGDDLVRMDTRVGQEVDRFRLDSVVGQPGTVEGVALGAGLVWAGRDVAAGQVVAIDPSSGRLRYRVDDVRHHAALAYRSGVVFAVDGGGVEVIDPAAGTVAEVRDISATAGYVTAGAGYGWTSDSAKGVVYKIDRDGRVVASYRTGLGANNLTFSDGRVWVANDDEGTVTGIDAITGRPTTYRFDHPVPVASAGGGTLLAVLGPGRATEERIDALTGKVIRLFSQQGALNGLEAALNTSPAALQIDYATCAKLLNYPDAAGRAGLRLRPEIAAAMPSVSADRRTYTFAVRRGYRFSPPSNQEVTAQTLRDSIERALSPKLGDFQPGAYWVDDIEGEQAFRDGKATHISGLRAHEDQLSITLTRPSPDFLERLALPFFCPVPLGTPTVPGGANRGRDPDYGMPSAGPYYVADWNNDKYVILKRNPNYHGPRPHRLDAIALREGVDAALAVDRIRHHGWDGIVSSGQNASNPIDPLLLTNGPLDSRYGSSPSGTDQYSSAPVSETGFLALNASSAPFARVVTRRAVALALDRASLAEIWDQAPTDALIPPNLDGQLTVPRTQVELAKARALMSGRTATAVMGIFKACAPCTQAARSVRTSLGRIGIRVQVRAYENPFQAAQDPRTPIDILDSATRLDFADPASFLTEMLSASMPAYWVPADVRRQVERLARLTGAERQSRAAQVARRLASRAAPVIAYGTTIQGELLAPSVGCRVFPPFSYGVDIAALCTQQRR
jgi:ABC-type oligopeptide transport system substrate-binding subunit